MAGLIRCRPVNWQTLGPSQFKEFFRVFFPNPKFFHSRPYEIGIGGVGRVIPHIGGAPAAELIRLLGAIPVALATFADVQPDAFHPMTF